MSGSFSSINTALSGLRAAQVGLNVTGNNISNVGVTGYSRQRADVQSAGAPPQTALWSHATGSGDGVRVAGVTRMVDELLNTRSRLENGNSSFLNTKAAVLGRVETGLGEPGDSGVSAALSKMSSAWLVLSNNPSSDAARAQVLSASSTVANAINAQSRAVAAEVTDQRSRVLTYTAQTNVLASDLASTNESIRQGSANGTDVSLLLDQRDKLAGQLSSLTGAVGSINPQGGMDMSLGGVSLVSGTAASTLKVASGVNADGTADGTPISLTLTDPAGGVSAVPAGIKGSLGGTISVIDDTLAKYTADLGTFASNLASEMNALHGTGFDSAGNPGGALFKLDPANPSGTLAVAITDRTALAPSGIPGQLDASVAQKLATTNTASLAYNRLVTSFGAEVGSVDRLAANQEVLTAQIDGSRDSLSGVNLDEEMVNMLSYQRSYESAARLLTTLDSVLDTIINRTGLTR